MLITTHSVLGAGIGVTTNDSLFAFLLAFFSHFVLDLIPHFDVGSLHKNRWRGGYEAPWDMGVRDYAIVAVDLIITLILLFYINSLGFSAALWWGALGGALPDILDLTPYWRNWFRKTEIGSKFHKFHDSFHYVVPRQGWWLGIGTQVIIIGGVLCLLFA